MATISQRGDGQWQTKIRKQGYPSVSKTFTNKRDAESWSRKTESEIERGTWRDSSEAESTTLADALTRYQAEIVVNKKGATKEASVVRMWTDTALAKNALARIRGADLAKLRDAWLAADYAPATVVRRLAVLSHLFSMARKEWGMEGLINPVESIKKPTINNERTRRVLEDEINRVNRATGSVILPSLITIGVETAMRREEIAFLEWKHIDLKNRTAHIPNTKNGYARTVPLSSIAVGVFEKLVRNISGRVFNITPDAITRAFTRATTRAREGYEKECEERGVEPDANFLVDMIFHDLRHEATTRLADKFALHELAKITGHRDTRMLLRYYHPRAEDLAKRLA